MFIFSDHLKLKVFLTVLSIKVQERNYNTGLHLIKKSLLSTCKHENYYKQAPLISNF